MDQETFCTECGQPLQPGEPCNICATIARIKQKARQLRREHAIKKTNQETRMPYADK